MLLLAVVMEASIEGVRTEPNQDIVQCVKKTSVQGVEGTRLGNHGIPFIHSLRLYLPEHSARWC